MYAILQSDKQGEHESRKQLQHVYRTLTKQVHTELKNHSVQTSAMISFTVWFIVITFYLILIPLDPVRSQATAGRTMQGLIYFAAFTNVYQCFQIGLHEAAIPHNIWYDFTQSILKDPHVLCLAVRKFDGKPELLDKWLDHNVMTFALFGVSIDRNLPGRIFAGMASLVISAAIVISRFM